MIAETPTKLTTADGLELEARVGAPTSPEGGAVICHPHPLYGVDMDNPVVIRLAEVFGELGLATLRFNFRGVGRSMGTHGQGVDEQRDVEAARAYIAALVGAGRPLV